MATVQDIEIPDSAARAAAIEEAQDIQGDKMVLNMGPSHPATHGVLRIVLELDGEVITKADPDVGYLHRGDEKIAENMTYTQFIPYTDRLDYLARSRTTSPTRSQLKNFSASRQLPPRCQYIRVMCAELARISAHLLGLGAFAMDTGASPFSCSRSRTRKNLQPRRSRERRALDHELHTHRRFDARCAPTWCDQVRQFLKEFAVALDEANTCSRAIASG